MGATFELTGQRALLLRGTEGEPVADPRRLPQIDVFLRGQRRCVQEAQAGSLASLPDLPAIDAASTANWISEVIAGRRAVPEPVARQVEHILQAVSAP
jgi:anthranilate phosphoribosyltransferase